MSETTQLCFHCNEPIPKGVHIMARLAPPQPMCCAGCAAVAELIAGAGLADYYRFRREPGNKPQDSLADRWDGYAQPEVAAAFVTAQGQDCSATVLVGGMRCAACVWLIERHLRDLPGIVGARVDVNSERAQIHWQADRLTLADVLRRIAALGYAPQPLDRARHADAIQAHARQEQRTMLKRLGIAALGMMQVMMYVLPLYDRDRSAMGDDIAQMLNLISLLITTPVLLYSGWPFLRSAARALVRRHINMDVPVALALLLAYFASVINTGRPGAQTYFDSVTMFIFLLTLGRYIEMRVRHRTGSITDALARMQPDIAHRRDGGDRSGQWRDVALSQLCNDDELLVRAGEIVPADGVLLSDQGTVNEALLTGESAHVAKQYGDGLLAGSINQGMPLRMRVTALGERTLLSGMVRMMEQAQFDKPRIATHADRVARVLLHSILWLSLLVGSIWYMVDSSRAFDAVLAVLVVTCPCALSLATPTVIAACISTLGRHGLLVARADAVERLAQIDAVWFDKTGTLTQGKLALQSVRTTADISAEDALGIAAALEAGAHHPLADAVRHAALANGATSVVATDLVVVHGQGVQGAVDQKIFRLGTRKFVAELRNEVVTSNEPDSGDEAVVLGDAQREFAEFCFRDALRTDAAQSVAELQQQGLKVALYSGDARRTVAEAATQLEIGDWHARQTPLDKLRALQASRQRVAMIGDGVNDAPVLAAAHVSIAMGQGAALAQAGADLLLVNPQLRSLPRAISIARRARQIMHQNLWWALAYNVSAVPLAALGWITPWVAALGMSISSVLVTLNAARVSSARSLGDGKDDVDSDVQRAASTQPTLQVSPS